MFTGVKKVDKGQYGHYVVTRKNGYGVFYKGELKSWDSTKSGAEIKLSKILNYFNTKEVK